MLTDCKIDIACFTETWLNNTISDAMINIEGFHLIRNDRNRHGGGICIYLRKDLAYRLIRKSLVNLNRSSNATEYLILEIHVGNNRLLLAVYYNPPEVDCSDLLQNHINEFSFRYSSTFFVGDFSTDLLKETRRSKLFNDVVASMYFIVVNYEPPSSSSIRKVRY